MCVCVCVHSSWNNNTNGCVFIEEISTLNSNNMIAILLLFYCYSIAIILLFYCYYIAIRLLYYCYWHRQNFARNLDLNILSNFPAFEATYFCRKNVQNEKYYFAVNLNCTMLIWIVVNHLQNCNCKRFCSLYIKRHRT